MSFRTNLYARLMLSAKRGASASFTGIPTASPVREPIATAPMSAVWGIPGVDLEVATLLPPSAALALKERFGVWLVETLQRVLPNNDRRTRWSSPAEVPAVLAAAVGEPFHPELGALDDASWARLLHQGPPSPLLERRGEDLVIDASAIGGVPRWPGLQPIACVAAIRLVDGVPQPAWIRLEDGGVVRPGEPGWEAARLVAGAGIQTWLVVGPHLMHTHFMVAGPMATLVHSELPVGHPVRRLLEPHVAGTLQVNHRAGRTLLGPHGNVQVMYSFPWSSVQTLAARAIAAFKLSDLDLPALIEARGMAGTSWPWAEDGLLLWHALHRYVTAWLSAAYASEAAIEADVDLQRLLARATRLVPGGWPASSREALARTLTCLVFGVTAFHRVVGGISLEYMTHPYGMPHRAWEGDSVQAIVPWREESLANLAAKFGTTYRTWRLVNAWDERESDPAFKALAQSFQRELRAVGDTIDARNRERATPFPWLHPDGLESSVAV